METHKIFCSACDRDVHVVISDGPSHDGQANLPDAEVVCLEIGEKCTGSLCPIGAKPPAVMAARLAHSGLKVTITPPVDLPCERCERVTSHVVIEHHFVTCAECGATSERAFAGDS